ncbi:thioredoxin domain-containing protein [Actinomyces sp. ZJ308]|uniref:DsbA family protein n=1 Tax=Actinomyces sp. ZJ308 TaxID=2708342 RepID=UPI00141E2999|nr:thioredoxin domain-containing protein [Actinomyces sp. ZJ308]
MSVQPPSATPTPAQSRSNRVTVITLVVIAVILAVIAALLLQNVASRHRRGAEATAQASTSGSASSDGSATAVPEPTPAPPVPDPQTLELIHSETHRDPADAQAKGGVDAPVVMVIYSDFACPYCTQFAQNVEPELADLVDQGTLRIEWRDLAQISPTSPLAAQAGRAAARQGRFWEFHDAVYAAADPQGHPEYTEDSLVAFARKAGVADIERFRTDMNAPETVTAVTEATNHAHSIGITGTPFMIVGETFISGYNNADYMRAVINSQAAKARTSATTSAPARTSTAPAASSAATS